MYRDKEDHVSDRNQNGPSKKTFLSRLVCIRKELGWCAQQDRGHPGFVLCAPLYPRNSPNSATHTLLQLQFLGQTQTDPASPRVTQIEPRVHALSGQTAVGNPEVMQFFC